MTVNKIVLQLYHIGCRQHAIPKIVIQVITNAVKEFFLRQFTVNFIYNNFLGV